ncbi:hypothetical protein EMA8858_01444 [Emticicia aquatica]|jgi:hypothetical protein|uniref:WbqC-like protein family protein n=1 Tax=Emticicia aquatica TaxID=1681835 RepID=A0ABN8ER07_9BACT|nr:WbqC family protein [Emticicia aquatica]CAH0995323.1 hypothetical protein EMA8858_01444 [Emticicia aquatica]
MKTLEKQTVVIDLQYLPCLEFFNCILHFDEIILESNENYHKQSYRNRCHILGANKQEMLIIPVLDGNKKTLIKDVKIDYSQRWTINHWRTIRAAYGKSPFFEFYSDYFQNIFEKKNVFLWDTNYEFLTICLKLMRVNKTIRQTEIYQKELDLGIFDARNTINPKKLIERDFFYNPVPYQQNFGNEFVPNLSILDLLFCRGNQALEILKKSASN